MTTCLYSFVRLHRAELYRLSRASIRWDSSPLTNRSPFILYDFSRNADSVVFRPGVGKRSTFRRSGQRQGLIGWRGAAAGDPDQQRQRRYRRNRREQKERHPTELVGEYPARRRHQRASHRRNRREQRVLGRGVRRRA